MQKIYLLLRNNKQTGPYSLDEIISKDLKSFDLIWVEGRSAGWRYPSEIDSLKPYLPDQPGIPEIKSPEQIVNQAASFPIATPIEATLKTSGKHIFVSMPAGLKQRVIEKPVETKAIQDIPQQVSVPNFVESVTSQATVQSEPVSEIKYARTLNEVEQEYANWVFKSKRKKSSLQLNQQTVVFGTIGVLVCAVLYFGISKLVSKNTGPIELAKTIDQKPVENTIDPSNTADQLANKSETWQTNSLPLTETKKQNAVSVHLINKDLLIETGNHKSYSNHTGKKSMQNTPAVKKLLVQDKQSSAPITVKQSDQIKSAQTTVKVQKTEQAVPKKKVFSAFLNGVFGKLKKKNNNQEPVAEKETTQASPLPSETRSNGERRATRRSDEANVQSGPQETETVDEKDFAPQAILIDLEGSERNNSWQLGIYDLKLTLLNRNNVPVRSAGVEVLYFDENNRLLEKKTVYFSNIAARSRATVKVPDQKWADHTDYRLIALK